MPTIYLLLGTNLGDKSQNLRTAIEIIGEKVGVLKQVSSVYETMPWGIEDQPIFYNQVIEIETTLEVNTLLATTQGIEKEMGRQKYRRWGERLIDIDILYYDQLVLESNDLNVPHAQIANRRFTLVPLADIAPDFIHPKLQLSQQQLLEQCPDALEVKKVED